MSEERACVPQVRLPGNRAFNRIKSLIALALLTMPFLAACAGTAEPIKPVSGVDLSLFMGRWYVIASSPTRFKRGGHNAVETCSRNADGTMCTWFRLRP